MEKGFKCSSPAYWPSGLWPEKTISCKKCLSSETAEFFSILFDIMTNCTNLHPTPNSDPLPKLKLAFQTLINNVITLKSPLGLPKKNNQTKPFIGFRDLITENYRCMPSTVLKCGKATRFNAHCESLTNTCPLASSFYTIAQRTFKGLIWGSTSSEALKIPTM